MRLHCAQVSEKLKGERIPAFVPPPFLEPAGLCVQFDYCFPPAVLLVCY